MFFSYTGNFESVSPNEIGLSCFPWKILQVLIGEPYLLVQFVSRSVHHPKDQVTMALRYN